MRIAAEMLMNGFTQVPNDIIHDPTLSPSAKTVYLVLLSYDHAGRKGRSWPSQTAIAKSTGLSARQVRRILKELEARGLLAIGAGPNRSNAYTLHVRCNGRGVIDHRTYKTGITGQEEV